MNINTGLRLQCLAENAYTVESFHNGHLRDRRKWPLWGGRGVILTIFLRKYNYDVYCAKFILTVSNNGNPIINDI